MKKTRVIVLKAAGTNCEIETAFAFQKAGATADIVHINQLIEGHRDLNDYHILVIPGGFTYGDYIASGKILANELKFKLRYEIQRFIRERKLILGICNGFQVLAKAGLLPNLEGDFKAEATLILNDSGRFEDRWVYLKVADTRCVWIKGIKKDIIYLPVAHAEGKFVAKDDTILRLLDSEGLVVFRYVDKEARMCGYPWNPNGSQDNIAGICDLTGRIFGLMPHPERYIHFTQGPHWHRSKDKKEGDGFAIFKNGISYVQNELL